MSNKRKANNLLRDRTCLRCRARLSYQDRTGYCRYCRRDVPQDREPVIDVQGHNPDEVKAVAIALMREFERGNAQVDSMPNTTQRDQVFFSYSHKDKKWLERFQVALKPLIRANQLSVWDDTRIKAGDIWRDEIKQALASAKVAVMLVSMNFLESDFIDKHELPPLLDAAQKEGLRILLVVVGHSLFEETELGRYQAVNDPSRPLASISGANREREIVRICREIRAVVLETQVVDRRSSMHATQEEVTPTLSILDVAREIFEHRDVIIKNKKEKCGQLAKYFEGIAETLEQLAKSIKSDHVPTGQVTQLATYAELLPRAVGREVTLMDINDLTNKLKIACDIEALKIEAKRNQRRVISQIEEAAGVFKALGASCRIHY